MILLP